MKYYFSLLLLFTFLTAASQQTIFYNARIFTGNRQYPYAEAIAIEGNKIIAVGNYGEVKKLSNANSEWMDMKGGFIMPGIVDSHNHGIHGGRSLTKPNVFDNKMKPQELFAFAKDALKKKDKLTGDILLIMGLNISTWSYLDELSNLLNKDEFSTQPLVLRGSDGHTGWCNKVMMKKAGLDKSFIQSLKAGEKVFFGVNANGEPTGFVSESGYQKISKAIPIETDFSKAAELTMIYNNANGITAFLEPTVSTTNNTRIDYLNWYQYLVKKNKLTVHIAGTVVGDANAAPQPQIAQLRNLQKKYNSRNFNIIGFKFFADGVIEHPTHTAALSLPYTGTDSKGVLMFDPKKFTQFAIAADKEKLLIHVHAIGDRAVTETLNGIEAARKMNHNNLAHSITHLQIVKPSDFNRFKELNVLASFQLLWAFGDVTTVDIVEPYIDSSLYKWQYPARSMLQAGATICGASDWPVSSANPFEAIYNAETRKGSLGVLDSTQCMPRMEMLYAYTIEAAKVLWMEKSIGSLEPGKYADMILLDRDILSISPEAMRDTKVVWTMFEGKKVYEAGKQK